MKHNANAFMQHVYPIHHIPHHQQHWREEIETTGHAMAAQGYETVYARQKHKVEGIKEE